ncbi:MAG: esterase [Deltaproteobacteria bacterium]|nr:esterase [Deltaproteobacteria bacterium]
MAVQVIEHTSRALQGNPLGDPHVRKLHLVVPDALPDHPIPCVWWLAGYAGVGRAMLGDDPWQEGLEERVARLMAEGRIGPMIVALPDAFTRLGGCQYLSSPAVGDYEQYLLHELRAEVEARFSISRHAIAGKSSGGFGAIVHAMRHPELFDAVVCHSGDMGFEMSLFPDIPQLMNSVRDHGSVEALVAAHGKTIKKKDGRWFGPLSMLALASVYSPDPDAPMGIGLPFDLAQGTLRRDVLERWLAFDPVRMIEDPRHQAALKGMRLVFVDCGRRDEHALHWGALTFHRRLEAAGIPHVYQEFDDGHRNTGYRLDESLPQLYAALSAP